jgi:hypothetical protein
MGRSSPPSPRCPRHCLNGSRCRQCRSRPSGGRVVAEFLHPLAQHVHVNVQIAGRLRGRNTPLP